MFRTLCLIAALILSPSTAASDPVDDLLAAAHAGDFSAVGRTIATASGSRLPRDLVWALAETHPDTVAFTKAWATADGDNPAALAARAWSLYWAAAILRNDRIVAYTAPALFDQARPLFAEAHALAKAAVALDPTFLPASDAVILTGFYVGDRDASFAEVDRIMQLAPNRHSLMLTAQKLEPAWGGSVEMMQAICDYYAGKVTDAPGFSAELCLAQAILRGSVWGERRDWAIMAASDHADLPFLEGDLKRLARDRALPPGGAHRLQARLAAEGRRSAIVDLAAQPDLLQTLDMPDKDGFAAALERDLSEARMAADRDPGSPATLKVLPELYRLEADFIGLQVLGKADPTQAEIEDYERGMAEIAERQAQDLDRRARRLLALAPQNATALQFAATHVRQPFPDPLASDRWAISLMTNAVIHANYQDVFLGQVATEAIARHDILRGLIASGAVPDPGAAALDEVYLCPYVRAIRVLDEVCAQHPYGEQQCIMAALKAYPSDSAYDRSPYSAIWDRGGCAAQFGAAIETLFYDLVPITPLP